MMKKTDRITRRKFVGGMLGGVLAAAVAPQFIPMRLLAAGTAPSNKIQLGHIGTGNQGTGDLRNFLAQTSDIASCVAICDPFRQRREKAATFVKGAQGHDPKLYNDFRELLADKGVDAVVIATPDHWHVPIGLAAVRAGKDVYIEKPLGHSLNQNRAMLDACKENNRIFQYGTQQRSMELIKRGVELVLNGYIGDLERLDVWAPGGRSGGSLAEIPVPEGLDYELYIGPAPMRPCSTDRITNSGSWYCSDYALGFIAGWGAHPLDVAIWGMEADVKGPFSIRGKGRIPTPDALFNTCTEWDVDVQFSNGVAMHFMTPDIAEPIVKKYWTDCYSSSYGKPSFFDNGTTFFGTKGWVSLSRSGVSASNPEWIKLRECEGTKRVLYKNHYYKAFVESVRDRSPSVAPIDDAVRSDALSHLSLMAIKTGGEVVWDPQKYEIKSPAALNEQMTCAVRGGWVQT
jgi:predicted dehydrogenase